MTFSFEARRWASEDQGVVAVGVTNRVVVLGLERKKRCGEIGFHRAFRDRPAIEEAARLPGVELHVLTHVSERLRPQETDPTDPRVQV